MVFGRCLKVIRRLWLDLFVPSDFLTRKDKIMAIYLLLLHIISAVVGIILFMANYMACRKLADEIFEEYKITLGDVVLYLLCGFVVFGNIIAIFV
jgi:hypothetical protein